MRFLLRLLAVLAIVAFAPVAQAQTTANQVVPGYVATTGCPNPNNTPCWVPALPSTPLGYQQLTSLGTAASLTVPAGSDFALIACTGQTVNWRDDGTAPTATVGMPLPVNTLFTYTGKLSAIQFIQTAASATCNVSYYH